jgi:glucose-6-phosphate isomerase
METTMMTNADLWARFRQYYIEDYQTGFALDVSRMNFGPTFLSDMESSAQKAFGAMVELEKGAISNLDEKRMVGHYWLRDAQRAPNKEIRGVIEDTLFRIKHFAAAVHGGQIRPAHGGLFENLLVVGIGGSALGPQFVGQALGGSHDRLKTFFFDNTDPDGMNKVLSSIPSIAKTLVVVISKSGGTKETRNGQLFAREAVRLAGLSFPSQAVAITGEGSELDSLAVREGWLARFPMWDWVGGRTSELSAVGLLPAALQGFDIEGMLTGAKAMDALTRIPVTRKNPAMMLALMWHYVGGGRGTKDMVVLPYKDRLELFSRYLQQLVMESLGKERDLKGVEVNQGIAVYGNKGSTDQHAYVQQLREGVHNFFVTFIEVLKDDAQVGGRKVISSGFEVEPGVTSGDYLQGFLLGTRQALYDKARESVTIRLRQLDAPSIGGLIALFERAVGFYANLIQVNAYHQPGVEAGKKAAAAILTIQGAVKAFLEKSTSAVTIEEIASGTHMHGQEETIFLVLERMRLNGVVSADDSSEPFTRRYAGTRAKS